MERDKDQSIFLNQEVDDLCAQGDKQGALVAFTKALKSDPNDQNTILNLSEV